MGLSQLLREVCRGSNCAPDCGRGFPVKDKTLDPFEDWIVAILNIDNFYGNNHSSTGSPEPETSTLSVAFVRDHHVHPAPAEKMRMKPLGEEIQLFKNEEGFEQIAKGHGVWRPRKSR